MFDFVSTYEIRLLSKLRHPDYKQCLPSQQRMRLELLGLIKDGPDGVQLTPKGVRVARVGRDYEEQDEIIPKTEVERLRELISEPRR
jgi:hypothetical protein